MAYIRLTNPLTNLLQHPSRAASTFVVTELWASPNAFRAMILPGVVGN